jgi:hypothetical protein
MYLNSIKKNCNTFFQNGEISPNLVALMMPYFLFLGGISFAWREAFLFSLSSRLKLI